MLSRDIEQAVKIIREKQKGVAFTGAGLSTASGIPDFRSKDGIWAQYPVREYAYIDAFLENPEKVWSFFRLRQNEMIKAQPNPGHAALAKMEELNYLTAVITQNIDGLHQKAGSVHVLELHGSLNSLVCLECGKTIETEKYSGVSGVPRCGCGSALKPGVVFFGEPLLQGIFNQAMDEALKTHFMILAGTSGVVYPAAQIPYCAKRTGGMIIEVNREETPLTKSITDVFLQGEVQEILPELLKRLI